MNLRWATFAIAGLFLGFLILFEILPGVFLGITALICFLGIVMFRHVEKTAMDTV